MQVATIISGAPRTPTLAINFTNTNLLEALALLKEQLFVTQNSANKVYVYNTTSFQLMRTITSTAFGYLLSGLATSAINNYLYIADKNNKLVHRVDLSVTRSTNLTSWSFTSNPLTLSLTSSGNVLVVTSDSTISEYTPSGSLVRSLTDAAGINFAIEVSSGVWAYSTTSPAGISVGLAVNGTVIKHWGSSTSSTIYTITQLNWPNGLVVDTQGYFLVADTHHNRLIAVNPSLTVARLLPVEASINLYYPYPLVLDQSSGRLYVGEYGANNRVLVFDNVANLYTLFN